MSINSGFGPVNGSGLSSQGCVHDQQSLLRNSPPRCECHDCTQARFPQPKQQMAGSVLDYPAIRLAQAMEDNTAAKRDAAVLAERERCAKIAMSLAGETIDTTQTRVRSLADWGRGFSQAQSLIAAKIREGK